LIIFRYLSKQIMQVMAAVTLILLVVTLTSRFIQYLGDAVAGRLASDVLLLLMFYRLPDFLLVIIPLALFLAILLAYGRMYAENEMVILFGAGFSERRLLLFTLGSSTAVLVLIAVLSLLVTPWGIRHTEQLKQNQEQLTEIDLIVAGQFQTFSEGDRVTYAERISRDSDSRRRLENVFVASSAQTDGEQTLRITIAESARPEIDAATGARFMRLENVMQYDGVPGQAEFTVGQFDVQSILLPEATEFDLVLEEKTLPTLALIGATDPQQQAELQWRLSMLLLIPVITLIAVPLSRVDPRQGRYGKLFPATVLYAVYFLLLQYAKDLLAEGDISSVIGMWWVHLLFCGIAFAVYRLPALGNRLARGAKA
jgi:lipopolysaccharide export system permease protein